MDRNVVTATILIALIMVVWMTWLNPSPSPETQNGPLTSDSTGVFRATEPTDQDEDVFTAPSVQNARVPETAAAEIDSTVSGATTGEVRLITVRTNVFTARLSTRGASLVSMLLSDYTRYDSDEPVQMIDTTRGGALGLVFTSPENRIYDTRSFVFDVNTPDSVVVVADSTVDLVFTAHVGSGLITERFTFHADSYEIGLAVQQQDAESFATQDGYELIWNGAIPFTEGDHENEGRRSGAFARSGGEVESVTLTSETYDEKALRGVVDWVAVKNKYFVVAVIPDSESRGADLIGERTGEVKDPSMRHDYTASLSMPPSTGQVDRFRIYAGPLEYRRLKTYDVGLYDMVDYGWDFFETVTRPLAKYVFIPTFALISSFIPNYGLVIILFSFLIKLVLFPLTKSSFKNMARMRELQPRMAAIKEKYADNPKKQQEATMKMYKETGVNPLGGCLPMLLQYPIIIALWQFLPQSIEIRQQGFLWASDLSAPDIILHLPFSIPMFGSAIAGFTLLMGISMVFQMKLQATPGTGAQQKIFTYVMPIFIFVIFNKLASGLNLYYLCYNVLTAVQQKVINAQLAKHPEEKSPEKTGRKGKEASKSTGRSQLSKIERERASRKRKR